ncbi:MAG: hypothetical protein ACC628_02785 [Pirellulaceae bacterium]
MSIVFELAWGHTLGTPLNARRIAWDERFNGFDVTFDWEQVHVNDLHWYSPLGNAFEASVAAIDFILSSPEPDQT